MSASPLFDVIGGFLSGNAQQNAANAIAGSYENGGQNLTNAYGANRVLLNDFYGQGNALLSPYAQAGQQSLQQLIQGLQPGGNLNAQSLNNLTPQQILAQNPGYQFDLQQGQQAIGRQAAAQGTLLSGGELKDINDYTQNMAQNAYEQAFQNYNSQQQQQFARLADLTGMGQQATGQQSANLLSLGGKLGSNAIDLANQQNEYSNLAAQTLAAGQLGKTDSILNGIGSGINSLGDALSTLFKPKA